MLGVNLACAVGILLCLEVSLHSGSGLRPGLGSGVGQVWVKCDLGVGQVCESGMSPRWVESLQMGWVTRVAPGETDIPGVAQGKADLP